MDGKLRIGHGVRMDGRTRPPAIRRSPRGFGPQRVIGDALRSRTDRRQATEVTVAVQVLNRMLELDRREAGRLA